MSDDFIGRGIGFPMRVDPTGGIALVSHFQELEEAMRLVLGTAFGERPMRPDFGCGIHDFVFSPVDASTAGHLAREVRSSLQRWEPRVRVVSVDVTVDRGDESVLYIDISYQPVTTNDVRNLVFPFYTIPAEEHRP